MLLRPSASVHQVSPNTVISWHSPIVWTWVLLCINRAIRSPIASVDLVMNASCAFNMATPASLLSIIYPAVVSHVLMVFSQCWSTANTGIAACFTCSYHVLLMLACYSIFYLATISDSGWNPFLPCSGVLNQSVWCLFNVLPY